MRSKSKRNKQKDWHVLMEELVSTVPFFKFGIVKAAATATLRTLCASKEINGLWEQCQAYASSHGMSPHTVFAAQYFYDLAQLSLAQAPAACTVGSYKGHFVRYLDWAIPEGMGEYTQVEDHTAVARKYQAIGFPGFFGLVTAVGDVCFAFNQMPSEHIDKRGLPTNYWAKLFYERVIRNHRGGETPLLAAVIRVLRLMRGDKSFPMSSGCIVLTDKDYNVRVSIHPGTETEMVMSSTEKVLVQANRFLDKRHKDYNDLMDDDCEEFSVEREKQMKYCIRRIAAAKTPVKAAEMALGMDEPVCNEATANVTYFNFGTKDVALLKLPEG
ncbi:MAG: hypothetical protein ACOYM3_29015 [Terrimicrobiaceae bacterium]